MRKLWWMVASILVAGSAASADTPLSDSSSSSRVEAPPRPMPKSVWSVADTGDAFHLQSGLSCPEKMGDFDRLDLMVYDRAGFDVSCNYRDKHKNLITIYLTRRKAESLADDFQEAKRELTQVTSSAVELTDAAQFAFSTDIPFYRAVYSQQDGALHSGIWVGNVSGWTLEYRATYIVPDEAAVMAELSLLTSGVEETAGRHLSTCAKVASPTRSGERIKNKDDVEKYKFEAAILGPIELKPSRRDIELGHTKIIWCADQSVDRSEATFDLLYGVFEDGTNALADEVFPITIGEPPVMSSKMDQLLNLIYKKDRSDPRPLWTISITNDDGVSIYGFFNGRPSLEDTSAIMYDIILNRTQPLLRSKRDGTKIIIEGPGGTVQ